MRLKFCVAVSKFAHCDLAPLSERGNNALQLLSRMSARIRLTVCRKASRGARVDRIVIVKIHVVPAVVKKLCCGVAAKYATYFDGILLR